MLSIISRKANLVDITVPGEVQSNFQLVPLESIQGNAGVSFEQYGKLVAGNDKIKMLYNKSDGVVNAMAGLRNE